MLSNGALQLPIAFIHLGAASLAWAGVAAAAIPIIIHILNRRRFKVVMWAAMEYLLAAMRKNRRRLRFEQLLLLITRCALLALLGLALARPGCDRNSLAALAGQRTGLHVFVIDNSYSMAYRVGDGEIKTHLDQAKDIAKRVIKRLGSGESVMVIAAGGSADAVTPEPVPVGADPQKLAGIIDGIEQSYGATDLAGALQKAAEAAKKQDQTPRRLLYLLTDCTRSALEDSDAPRRSLSGPLRQAGQEAANQFLQVLLFPLGSAEQWNYAVLDVRPAARLANQLHNEVKATVAGYGAAAQPQLEWKYNGQAVPGGADRPVLSADPKDIVQSRLDLKDGGPHVLTVSLTGDEGLGVDNTRWRVIDVAQDMRVLIVEGSRGAGVLGGSGDFLKEALAPESAPTSQPGDTGRRSSSYVAPEVIGDLDLRNKTLSDYRAVILTNVAQVAPDQGDRLRKYVEQGGTLMLFMGEQVNLANYNQVLLERKLLPGKLLARKPLGTYLFDFNPSEPGEFLTSFRDKPQCGLKSAQTSYYIQVDPAGGSEVRRVLNYIATGDKGPQDPAITVHPAGKGQVVFWSMTANGDWTNFQATPAFLELVHEILAGTVNVGDEWMNRMVGEKLEIPPWVKRTAEPKLLAPGGKDEVLLTVDKDQVFRSPPLARPGVYQLNVGRDVIPIAVNVPPEEADIRTVPAEQVGKTLGDIKLSIFTDSVPAGVLAGDLGNEFGWLAMMAVLLLVGVECLMAMHFGHYRRKGSAELKVLSAEKTAQSNPPTQHSALSTQH